MHKLTTLIDELESKIDFSEKLNSSVSTASVGWHLDHALLVVNKVINGLVNSDPTEYKASFNFKRILVFTLNKIPRGKGKAPESVTPDGTITVQEIISKLEKAKVKINSLSGLHLNKFIVHPFFGQLNTKNTIKFLEIHTRHHLQIINDILKAG